MTFGYEKMNDAQSGMYLNETNCDCLEKYFGRYIKKIIIACIVYLGIFIRIYLTVKKESMCVAIQKRETDITNNKTHLFDGIFHKSEKR